MSATDPMAALRARFLARCAEDLAAVRAAMGGEDVADLRQRIHRLAGAAGVFGHEGLGARAAAIDEAWAAGEPPGAEALADLAAALGKVC